MTIFRCSACLTAVLFFAPSVQAQTNTDAPLRMAAKAAIGGLHVKQNNVPSPGETTIIKAEQLLELPFGPVLITTVKIEGGAHAEAGALGVYYLRRRRGEGFVLRKSWPHALDGNGFGYPPKWSVSNRFTEFPALVATAGWTGQGCTSNWLHVAELTPRGPTISGPIHTYYTFDHFGDGKPDELDGRIANIRKARSFDVVVHGTAQFSEHYVFRNGRFVRLERDSRLGC
jgi:hypothetical protein